MTRRRVRLTPTQVLRVTAAPAPPATISARWRDDAGCADSPSAMWFPEEAATGVACRRLAGRTAVNICDACPVRPECLTVHRDEPYGIFGGLHSQERQAWTRLHRVPRPFHHGDEAGAQRHRRAGEPVCPACLAGARLAAIERTARARREMDCST